MRGATLNSIVLVTVLAICQYAEATVWSRCQLVKELKKYTVNKPNFSNTLLSNCKYLRPFVYSQCGFGYC